MKARAHDQNGLQPWSSSDITMDILASCRQDALMSSDSDCIANVVRRMRRRRLWEAQPTTKHVDYRSDTLHRLLQHRAPFLLVDRITAVDPDRGRLEGSRRIDPDDPVLAGHFPGEPVYPGALQIEMAGQLGLCSYHFYREQTVEVSKQTQPRRFRAVKVHHAAFLGALLPGDEVTLLAEIIEDDSLAFTCAGQLLLGEEVKATTVLEAYLVDG